MRKRTVRTKLDSAPLKQIRPPLAGELKRLLLAPGLDFRVVAGKQGKDARFLENEQQPGPAAASRDLSAQVAAAGEQLNVSRPYQLAALLAIRVPAEYRGARAWLFPNAAAFAAGRFRARARSGARLQEAQLPRA